MKQKEVNDLTKDEITDINMITSILENTEENKRLDIIGELKNRAKELKVLTQFNTNINKLPNTISITSETSKGVVLATNQYGKPEATSYNFITIMENDPKIKGRMFEDIFRHIRYKIEDSDKISRWTDTDDAKMRCYIEKQYGIHDINKYKDAIKCIFDNHQVHPLKEILEEKEWDGKPRIDTFLKDVMKCEDSIYTREVSRMIFYGGINRVYDPGCKFDYMPIFIGKQGCAKSLMVSLLGLEEYSADIYTIEGKDGMGLVQGKWVCEMSELLAMCRYSDVEGMKAFLTRQIDDYRPPYSTNNEDRPRTCIFIGTTNDDEFLTDKTGNRRYLPIKVHSNGYEIYKNKDKIKLHILECWREALYLMRNGETYLAIDPEYLPLVEEAQRSVIVEDPKELKIRAYLLDKPIGYKVCIDDVWTNALGKLSQKCSPSDSRIIGRILTGIEFLEKSNIPLKIDNVSRKVWIKVANPSDNTDDNSDDLD